MVNGQNVFMRQALEQILSKFQQAKPDLVLFTTFNFSSGFFETNILPLLVGNSTEEITASNTVTADIINVALNTTRTVVVCDRSAKPQPKGDLRYGLLPVGLEKGRFHPKIILVSGILVSGAKGLWLCVGSGNLSLSGWALNREIVGITPVAQRHCNELRLLLKWLLREAERRVEWSESATSFGENALPPVDPAAEEGATRAVLENLLADLELHALPDAQAPDAPSLHLALPSSIRGENSPSLLASLTGGKNCDRLTVVSPYWADVPSLVKEAGAKECRFVPSMRPDGSYSFPLESVASKGLGGSYGFLKFADDPERYTHAKAIMLEQEGSRALCIGSANFTTAALLHGAGRLANVEAMLRYRMPKGERWETLYRDLDPNEVTTPDENPENEGAPELPPFDAEVTCDWKQRKFFCRVMVHRNERLDSLVLEVADQRRAFKTEPAEEQRFFLPFRGTLPVRSFFVRYASAAGEPAVFQGLVTQMNAEEDELGYRPRPRLDRVLDLLCGLDPSLPDEVVRRRGEGADGSGDEEVDGDGPSFDFYKFFQATFKMRRYYESHPELDPFSKYAFQGLPVLHRAVTLQPAQGTEEKIGRYVQLSELLETLKSFHGRDAGALRAPAEPAIKQQLSKNLEEELASLEKEMASLLGASRSFAAMFGSHPGKERSTAFLDWFRRELTEQKHVH